MSVDPTATDCGRPEKDIDGLLRTFFQAQLPQPWPKFQPPAITHRLPSRRPLMRSRLALAASVALLAFGHWFMTSNPTDEAALSGGGPLSAGREKLAPGDNKYLLKESLLQEAKQPTKYLIEVYERK